jgi:predicted  nucleic acid-binding Zn-ribbon protein
VQFARARLVALEQMRADPKVTRRGQQTHQMLEDFLSVYDELNNNLDNFESRRSDLRKALKYVIEGDTEFQAKLRALKDDARTSKEEAADYQFILSNAIDSVDSNAEDHRKMLTEQQEMWKHKKRDKS